MTKYFNVEYMPTYLVVTLILTSYNLADAAPTPTTKQSNTKGTSNADDKLDHYENLLNSANESLSKCLDDNVVCIGQQMSEYFLNLGIIADWDAYKLTTFDELELVRDCYQELMTAKEVILSPPIQKNPSNSTSSS